MKKVLFIVWDGPQVNYLEGLFYPIFQKIQEQKDIQFHIIQFTWGNPDKIAQLNSHSRSLGFQYAHFDVSRKPHPAIGSLITVWKGARFIEKYIRAHKIDIIMPRSTMPSLMINRISGKLSGTQIIFDADGLPLEERVDFSGLKYSSLYYKILKASETALLKKSDAVITRSLRSIDIHLETIGREFSGKFFTVGNGRDPDFFKPDVQQRTTLRNELGIAAQETVFVYCGSLGLQYGVEEMIAVFDHFLVRNPLAKFLIITGDPDYLLNRIPSEIAGKIIIKSLGFKDIPRYLNIADIAFAIRQPTYSMQGIAPIKLGEYMLMGLPCIASKGIGDTEAMLKQAPDCLLFEHNGLESIEQAAKWALMVNAEPDKIRSFALQHFTLQKSAMDYIKAIDHLLTA